MDLVAFYPGQPYLMPNYSKDLFGPYSFLKVTVIYCLDFAKNCNFLAIIYFVIWPNFTATGFRPLID